MELACVITMRTGGYDGQVLRGEGGWMLIEVSFGGYVVAAESSLVSLEVAGATLMAMCLKAASERAPHMQAMGAGY